MSRHCKTSKNVFYWLVATVLLLTFVTGSKAQDKKAYLSGITSVGIAIGENENRGVYQFSGGLNYGGRFFTGVGVAYDTYRFNSIPVFADWRVNFGEKRVMFLYANGGYHFPTSGQRSKEVNDLSDKLQGGYYFDGGFGVQLPIQNVKGVSISAGYSQKQLTLERESVNPCLVAPCPVSIAEYKYQLGRIMARISWEFGRR